MNPTSSDESMEGEWQEDYKRPRDQDVPFSLAYLIAEGIDSGDIQVDKCDVAQLLSRPVLRTSSSSSKTIAIWGDLKFTTSKEQLLRVLYGKTVPAIIKISFESTAHLIDNSLQVEVTIYKKLINNILKYHLSPNVVGYFGSFKCDLLRDIKGKTSQLYHGISKQIDALYERSIIPPSPEDISSPSQAGGSPSEEKVKVAYDFDDSNFLLLEKIDGPTLRQWLQSQEHLYAEDLLSIMFQVLYTLMVFNSFGLRHNDLHQDNILLENLSETPTHFVYFITDEIYFAVPVTMCAKIFDFDLSSFLSPDGVNTKLTSTNFCKSYGMCNAPNTKFDTFTFISEMWTYVKNKENRSRIKDDGTIKALCEKIVKPTLLKQEFGYPFRLCKFNPVTRRCNGNWEPSDQDVLDIPAVLFLPEFKRFRHKLPQFDSFYLPENIDDFQNKDVYHSPTVNKTALMEKLNTESIVDILF